MRTTTTKRYLAPIALLALGAAMLVWQLLLPGFIGVANNGDFGKVYGWLCLAPAASGTDFAYFQPDYVRAARAYWDSPYHSSESALAWLATRIAGATYEGAPFDIRWLGAIHMALCLAAYAALLAGLRRLPRWVLAATAAVPLLVFTDVCYSAWLNSFYMDAAAFCGLLLMAASAVWIAASERPRTAQLGLFALAALLFVTSKAQHAIWMWLPAAFLAHCGHRAQTGRLRATARGAAALVMLAGVFILGSSDRAYRGQAMFNLLFFRLGPRGADLQALGARPEELRYSGMHSYMPGAPTADRQWTEDFYARTGFGRLLGWYARHPADTFQVLRETLTEGAPEMRPVNLGNFRVQDGRPPGARTQRLAAWSDLRSALLRRWPWHLVLWYAAFIAVCVVIAARDASPVVWVAIGIAVLGTGEFLAASLGDCLDAGRHLFLFQAATDLTVCFAAAWAIRIIVGTHNQRT